MKAFEQYQLKNLNLKNRLVMPPMCMYTATAEGLPTTFHLAHYGARAIGGIGLIIVESTAVTPGGRISDHDLGLWQEEQIIPLKKIVDAVHLEGTQIALQLNHAGRRSTSASANPLAPSPLAFSEEYRTPEELSKVQIAEIIQAFQASAIRAAAAGFDAIEIHAAHGYLLHSFLSPLSNKRTDEYGGSLQNRIRILKEILVAIRAVWPAEKALWVRVTAKDYTPGGIDIDMMVAVINEISSYIDLVHVSSGGLLPFVVHDYPGYQIPLSEKIRTECSLPTIAVGLLNNIEMAEEILQNGRADLVAFGRKLLRDPNFPMKAAIKYKVENVIPLPYERAFPLVKKT